jgi:hypothetical protein
MKYVNPPAWKKLYGCALTHRNLQHRNRVEQLFIEVAFHQNAFSLKQLFIESSHRWLILKINEY